jgi:hypothetical protein
MSYEELCRAHIEALIAAASAQEVQSELSQRVATWRQRIDPVLRDEESRCVSGWEWVELFAQRGLAWGAPRPAAGTRTRRQGAALLPGGARGAGGQACVWLAKLVCCGSCGCALLQGCLAPCRLVLAVQPLPPQPQAKLAL